MLGEVAGKAGQFITNLVRGEMDRYVAAFSGALKPWLMAFATGAVPKIKSGFAAQRPCECTNGDHGTCPHMAALPCEACGKVCCLYHAFLTWKGDAVCWHCVAELIQGKSPGAGHDVRDDQRKRAQEERIDASLKVLGLGRSASFDDIKRAFREFAAKNHPDRARPEDRAEAERRFKLVSEAYNFLQEIGYGK
jgi:DnaJ-class molecular chaperone